MDTRRCTTQWLKLLGIAGLALAVLAGCSGNDGAAGPAGQAAVGTAPASSATALNIAVTGVTIASPPVIRFRVTDQDGNGALGLTLNDLRFTVAKLIPGANGGPSTWQNYVNTVQSGTSNIRATAEGGTSLTSIAGSLVDNGDGSYTYTFKTDIVHATCPLTPCTNAAGQTLDLSYNPGLTHRFGIQTRGSVPIVNAVYDLKPSTGATTGLYSREIVSTTKCNECHSKLAAHGGSRVETKFCVTCHNPGSSTTGQIGATATNLTVDFKVYIHKIHMSEELPSVLGADGVAGTADDGKYMIGASDFSDVAFPQDLRNCTKCHDGANTATPQGDNWKTQPSIEACGSCHDNVNFATGANHAGGIKDNSTCFGCHSDGGMVGPVESSHVPVTPPDPKNSLLVASDAGGNANTNAAYIAANHNHLPTGAIKVTYDVQSVGRDSNKNPYIVFRLLQNGARADFNVFGTGKTEIWDNFIGSPSAQFVFAVPQDGINAPADYNQNPSAYIKFVWNGVTGASTATMTGPDSNGYYTLTLTGTVVPDNAVMLTGGIGFGYGLPTKTSRGTQPLTQTNLTAYPVSDSALNSVNQYPGKIGGLLVAAPTVQKVATGYTARRPIVDNSLCNKCHEKLGVFTASAFHAGQRNDANTCAWCHRPNQTSSGWSADSESYIHAIHAADKRTNPFTWHASSTTASFADVRFPGILKNCQACHLPGTYDFNASASASAVPNRLYRTVGQGIYNRTAATSTTTYTYSSSSGTCVAGTSTQTAVGAFSLSPVSYGIVSLQNYGLGFTYNAGKTTSNLCTPDTGTVVPVAAGATREADSTTLVISPITTACFACHDGTLPRLHMETYGASIYKPRSVALGTVEQCLTCHGPGRIAAIADMHAK